MIKLICPELLAGAVIISLMYLVYYIIGELDFRKLVKLIEALNDELERDNKARKAEIADLRARFEKAKRAKYDY